MENEILIKDYNSNWAKEFEEKKGKSKEILNDNIISIEHIGSTSIMGLEAKPIIDIAIGVMDLETVMKMSISYIGGEIAVRRCAAKPL
ncbi:GrpB family protein [Cytobacillus firmus]|uniref:GrpB family protein n=1 Tax=Cytobacillus firmus TaxID=1399 RepID=UPI002494AD87|nr:GrpB family protein [Cytobacillus firmus]